MGLWDRTKRTAKYVVWGMPTTILGVPVLRASSQQIRDLYRSLTWPVCPECQHGTLVRIEPDDPKAIDTHWHCRKCKSVFIAPADAKEANAFFSSIRHEAAVTQMFAMGNTTRADLMRGHRFRSRWYYGMTAAFLMGFFFNIAVGSGVFSLLNWLILAFVMFIFGLKASYRYWQITTGVVFEAGAFRRWFWRGRWFV
jgi:ribosomal protein L37AE/L43A